MEKGKTIPSVCQKEKATQQLLEPHPIVQQGGRWFVFPCQPMRCFFMCVWVCLLIFACFSQAVCVCVVGICFLCFRTQCCFMVKILVDVVSGRGKKRWKKTNPFSIDKRHSGCGCGWVCAFTIDTSRLFSFRPTCAVVCFLLLLRSLGCSRLLSLSSHIAVKQSEG